MTSNFNVYNEGKKHGVTELLGWMYFSNPVPGAIAATIKLKKLTSGPFGTEVSMTFPKIVSGAGSITSLVIHLGKGIGFRGAKHSVIGARCPDGGLESATSLLFANGTEAIGGESIPCTGLPPRRR